MFQVFLQIVSDLDLTAESGIKKENQKFVLSWDKTQKA